MSGKTVLVGGGSGFVGAAIGKRLLAKGYDVVNITRAGKAGVTWEHIAQHGAPASTIGAINVAGSLILDPLRRWTSEYKEECYASRVNTTRTLALAVKSARTPAPLIATSAIGYYATNTPALLDETSANGDGFFARLCADVERAAGEVAPARVCVVRPGVVYGRGGGAFAQLKLPFSLGVGGEIGTGSQFVPFVHVDDLARLYVHLLESEQCHGAYNGVAPELATNRDFTQALGAAMHRPTVLPVPAFAMRLAFGAERAEMLLQSQRVAPVRTLASGFRFQYASVDAVAHELVAGH